jgi:hypothetical protein
MIGSMKSGMQEGGIRDVAGRAYLMPSRHILSLPLRADNVFSTGPGSGEKYRGSPPSGGLLVRDDPFF